jgi:rfaE bifunctional protein kinase chain/domain
MPDETQQLIEQFNGLNVLILGDVMVDSYLWGDVSRISPEAPVPITSITHKEHRLGGSGNVAMNIKALGATPYLCSVIGADETGQTLLNLLQKRGMPEDGIIQGEERTTTEKTRIFCRDRQLFRYDQETTEPISDELRDQLIQRVEKMIGEKAIDVVIFQDYDKGVLTMEVIQSVIEHCNSKSIPTAVDPKKQNFFTYQHATLFKPNLVEVREGLNTTVNAHDLTSLKAATAALQDKLAHTLTLITLSEFGAFIADEQDARIVPARVRNIADVSGAGDTVISVASLCLALRADSATMAELANIAGGLVCETVGVTPVDKVELVKEVNKEKEQGVK